MPRALGRRTSLARFPGITTTTFGRETVGREMVISVNCTIPTKKHNLPQPHHAWFLTLVLENEWLYSFCLKCFPMTNDPLLANNTRAGNSENNSQHGNSSPFSFVLRYHV